MSNEEENEGLLKAYSRYVQQIKSEGRAPRYLGLFGEGFRYGREVAKESPERVNWTFRVTVFNKVPRVIYFTSARRALSFVTELTTQERRFVIQKLVTVETNELTELARIEADKRTEVK